jgi:hypothetical protein
MFFVKWVGNHKISLTETVKRLEHGLSPHASSADGRSAGRTIAPVLHRPAKQLKIG